MCPLLVANNGDVTDYTQPLNVADDLSLITLNTPVRPCSVIHVYLFVLTHVHVL